MAIKPTIYKAKITLADTDRSCYDTLNLTVALHPSETVERMMARILAFCLNAQEQLTFTKGLCAAEEPDIRACTLDNSISLWIDVGEPAVERVKKATRLSEAVKVYSFNSKSDTWWEQGQAKFSELPASFYQFKWKNIQELATLAQRTMNLSITISGGTAYVSAKNGECAVPLVSLQVA